MDSQEYLDRADLSEELLLHLQTSLDRLRAQEMMGWETKTPQEAEEIRQFSKAITKLKLLWEADIQTGKTVEKQLIAKGEKVRRRKHG